MKEERTEGKCLCCGQDLKNTTRIGYHYPCFIATMKIPKKDIPGTGFEILDAAGERVSFDYERNDRGYLEFMQGTEVIVV